MLARRAKSARSYERASALVEVALVLPLLLVLAFGVVGVSRVVQARMGVSVRGVDGGDVVMVETQGRLRLILPWVGDASLPLHAQAMMNKEAFHAGPSR